MVTNEADEFDSAEHMRNMQNVDDFPAEDFDDEPHRMDPISLWHRWLAAPADGASSRIDYSVLSVSVMTLGLIMMVEVFRHRLDHSAKNKPFFKAVLEGVYAELSTLGMVELFIFILHKYYDNLDIAKEQVFASVHFTLFYTAILNAFQSVLIAWVARRRARRIWVQTETLELNHYVEIREEFERVSRQLAELEQKNPPRVQENGSTSSSDDKGDDKAAGDSNRSSTERKQSAIRSLLRYGDDAFEFSLGRLCRRIVEQIRYPRLRSKYDRLLIQVRYHEMRLHFLQAYSLPLKLKISDYLLLSQQQVLINLVHVSIVAWLLLTGATNLLYFTMGLVAYETEDSEIVGTAMIWIFYCSMVFFVGVSLWVYWKMQWIFRQIMHKKQLWDPQENEQIKEELAEEQLNLFWLGDPKLVIAAIQFMNFGYAVALSVVLIFYEVIDDGTVPMQYYFIAIGVCYALFVLVMSKVIPSYTLCTSLGQLVNRKRLNETLAAYHIEEAKRQRLAQLEFAKYQELDDIEPEKVVKTQTEQKRPSSPPGDAVEQVRQSISSAAQGIKQTITKIGQKRPDSSEHPEKVVETGPEIAELVKMDTDALRATLPESERLALSLREYEKKERKTRRSQRRKTLSDGVAAMAGRKKTLSDGVSSMASGGSLSAAAMGALQLPPRTVDDSDIPQKKAVPLEVDLAKTGDSVLQERAKQRADRRHRRKKSMSDGVAAMAYMRSPRLDTFESIPEPVPEESTERENADHDLDIFSPGLEPQKDSVFDETAPSLNAGLGLEASTKGNGDASGTVDVVVDTVMPLDEEVNGSSIDSVASVGERSDFDDVPEIDPSFLQRSLVEYEPRRTFRDRLQSYYLSKRFVLVSNVFGTMVAFFFVGQRIERFLHTENIVSNDFVSFDFDNTVTFWLLTTWFAMFLMTTCLIFWSLQPCKGSESNRERSVLMGAVIDAVITAVCLTVFFVAEAQRCCYPDNSPTYSPTSERFLAGGDDKYGDSGPAPCSCPTFGSRLYGGLGTIEPYTSLIALRIFRHWVSRSIVRYMDARRRWSAEDEAKEHPVSPTDKGISTDPFAVFESEHGHSVKGLEEEKGTIAELWEAAIAKYPDIVATYGEFSGELLQAMLGVTVIPGTTGGTEKVVVGLAPPPSGDEVDEIEKSGHTPTLEKQPSYSIQEQYSKLNPHAQEIIMAGRLGHKVKSVANLQSLSEDPEAGIQSDNLFFHLDTDVTPAISIDMMSMFTYPNARLIRSMRRCDRKLLPILNEWTVVDVVLTRFEMVYFEAIDADKVELDEDTADTRQAMVATKGGKGLRLCDVADGRRVVGHLNLSDISCVMVEREMPHELLVDDSTGDNFERTEYWHQHNKTDTSRTTRGCEWHTVKEDRLRIQTTHGNTLYLRFYADLEEAESHMGGKVPSTNELERIAKDNAFQWAQTIVRICGPEQLLQPLPHFGDDTNDELLDFLVVNRHDGSSRSHRRLGSDGNLRGHRRLGSGGEGVAHRLISRRNLWAGFERPRLGSRANSNLETTAEEDLQISGEGSTKPSQPAPPHRPSSVNDGGASSSSLLARYRRSSSLDYEPKPPISRRVSWSGDVTNITSNRTKGQDDQRTPKEVEEDEEFFGRVP